MLVFTLSRSSVVFTAFATVAAVGTADRWTLVLFCAVANIDPEGYMQITDRSKDVIKSGGEWISSIDVENIAMSHPAVEMAACVGVPHPKWDERPIVIVVVRKGQSLKRDALLQFYEGKTAKWQIPSDVVFMVCSSSYHPRFCLFVWTNRKGVCAMCSVHTSDAIAVVPLHPPASYTISFFLRSCQLSLAVRSGQYSARIDRQNVKDRVARPP